MLLLGLPKVVAEGSSTSECSGITVKCAGGGAGIGIVCSIEDVVHLANHICQGQFYIVFLKELN